MYGRSKNMLRHIKTSYTLESELKRALKKQPLPAELLANLVRIWFGEWEA